MVREVPQSGRGQGGTRDVNGKGVCFIRCIAIESLIELASGITDGQMTTMYSKVPMRGCAEWVCPVAGEGPFEARYGTVYRQ